MTVEYLELSDDLAIAAAVTGLDVTTLTHVTRLSLADSALHAPAASFDGVEFYPDFVDKAAVLLVRLARNHPLPDGNKRAVWVSMRMFVGLNGWEWRSYPDIDDAESTVLAVSAGTLDEAGCVASQVSCRAPGMTGDGSAPRTIDRDRARRSSRP